MKIKLFTVLMGLVASLNINSQELKSFSLEDLNFGGKNYRNMVPQNRNCVWWGDQLVRVENDACYLVNKQTGKETLLFDVNQANKWAGDSRDIKFRSLRGASFPYADKPIVVVNAGERVYTIDFKKGGLKICREFVEGEEVLEMNSKSEAVAYLKDNNLYVTRGLKQWKLSDDGSREIVYGQSVHRDEFGIRKGTFFSNNGEKLAFYRMDQSMVTDYPLVNIPEINFVPDEGSSRIATLAPEKYPMAGETSHKVTVGVFDSNTGKTVYLKAGDPTNRYFTNIAWSPDDKTVYMFELNRDQNDCRLTSYDATTGEKTGELYREVDAKYVEPQHPIVFLPWDDKSFIMQSRQDGYNHLYLCSIGKSGSRMASNTVSLEVKQLTSGRWEVLELLGFNAKRKGIIIASNELNPIQRNLFFVDVATGKRTLVDEGGKGWHYGSLSASGQFVYDNYSEPNIPRNIAIVNVATGKRLSYFKAEDPWKGYNVPEYTCGTLKAADGETDLYWRMVKPVNFDPNKKYPTVVYVYGGPHAHNVDARWHYCSRSWETYMAQKGYVLFILDNRGSEHRGKDFEQATFRQLGQEEMKDQMKGVEYLKSLPYVDADRIGVHGWSYGGFMTISLMTNYPDVFKVGVAGGPVIDWKWYEVMYGERYMETEQTNPEGFAAVSLIPRAKDLRGKLLICQGAMDNTVVWQHSLNFIDECIRQRVQVDYFPYPRAEHNVLGRDRVHLMQKVTDYFDDFLK